MVTAAGQLVATEHLLSRLFPRPPMVLGLASRLVQGTPRHPATVIRLVAVQRLAKAMALAVVQAATMATATANPKPKGPNYAAPI